MLLLIMGRYLEVADRRMTAAITLVLAQPLGAGAPPLVRQLMGNRMLHRGPFAQRGPDTLLVLRDGQKKPANRAAQGGCGAREEVTMPSPFPGMDPYLGR